MAATPNQIALTPLAPGSLDAALNWRYAVKAFDASRPIEPTTWAALENSLTIGPQKRRQLTIGKLLDGNCHGNEMAGRVSAPGPILI